MRPRLVSTFTIVVFVAAACTGGASTAPGSISPSPVREPSPSQATSPSPDAVELTIFGAASLKGALEKAKTVYEAGHPATTVTLATDSSSALRTQIEQGAPADVFLSADTTNPRTLVEAGLTAGEAVDFAGNVLTIVVPADNPADIRMPANLARVGVKVIAAGEEVPITKYATQVVDRLAKVSGYPPDFAADYAANIVSREDNVKAIVAKIELGEGDAGIVYVTDAKASALVDTVGIPDEANVPATYAGVVVKASSHVEAAQAFLDWFAGSGGQEILAEFGFLPPPP